ncbi:MAG TPA: NAD(P)H-dependent oxidoreductase [Casimicrobiaceae bacterium]|nr:NAD(P)H-dependent oxidoreductase [Casimicrobiaceae bacterium]
MAESLRILGVAGSLRRGSFNRWLLDNARALAPPTLDIEPFDIDALPLYNADLDNDAERPQTARRLKEAIAACDGVLIVTPEYNHGVPGVTQNVIDWASRPAFKSPLVGKPVAMMGASGSASATMRGQQMLKLVLMSTLAEVFPHPGVGIPFAKEKFDADGRLAHEPTREFVAAFLRDFERWIRRFSSVDSS